MSHLAPTRMHMRNAVARVPHVHPLVLEDCVRAIRLQLGLVDDDRAERQRRDDPVEDAVTQPDRRCTEDVAGRRSTCRCPCATTARWTWIHALGSGLRAARKVPRGTGLRSRHLDPLVGGARQGAQIGDPIEHCDLLGVADQQDMLEARQPLAQPCDPTRYSVVVAWAPRALPRRKRCWIGSARTRRTAARRRCHA